MLRDLEALHLFIDARQAEPHAFGRSANDCVGFVLGAVQAQTGEEIAPELVWKDRTSARRLIKRLGGLEAAFDAHFERVPPALAARGDVAGVPDPAFGLHPLIVEGLTLVGPGERGNRRLPRSAMTVAWRALSPAADRQPETGGMEVPSPSRGRTLVRSTDQELSGETR